MAYVMPKQVFKKLLRVFKIRFIFLAFKLCCTCQIKLPKKNPGIENFEPKKSFDHLRHLTSRVPRWAGRSEEQPVPHMY